jgi:CheY-like chemotaxis protein
VVVVVDDDQLTRLLAQNALAGAGYDVDGYETATEALSALLQGAPAIACVVDQVMNGTSGTDLVRSLRGSTDPRLRALPVVGISSRFGADLLAAGADTAVAKPFEDGALRAAVERAIRARAG